MAQVYIDHIQDSKDSTNDNPLSRFLVCDFLYVLIDYEHFIPLNLPLPVPFDSVDSLTSLI